MDTNGDLISDGLFYIFIITGKNKKNKRERLSDDRCSCDKTETPPGHVKPGIWEIGDWRLHPPLIVIVSECSSPISLTYWGAKVAVSVCSDLA